MLCRFGIEYVEDPKTGDRIPTCHRTCLEPVTKDEDYRATLDYADEAQQKLYEQEARTIDRLQRDILAVVKEEKPFDVFICYKETDGQGKRTVDSAIANDIYHQLTQAGLKVFYAAITLEDKLGQAYEPYIFAALNSAKVMLALGTRPEYFTAVWVKNEWGRFLKLAGKDKTKLLIPCYRDMDPYELPEEFAHLQAQDMGKIGFINDVIRGIQKVLGAKQSATGASAHTEVLDTAPLLRRAFMFLEDGDWKSSDEYCEKVLDREPENVQAYLCKLMAQVQVNREADLANSRERLDKMSSYQKIMRYGDEELKQRLQNYCEQNKKFVLIIDDQKRKIYDTANKILNNVGVLSNKDGIELYQKAQELFELIPDYLDSRAKRQKCIKAIKRKTRKANVLIIAMAVIFGIGIVALLCLYLFGEI